MPIISPHAMQPESAIRPGASALGGVISQAALLVLIAAVALFYRVLVLDRTNLDLIDHFLPWLEDMRTRGFWAALATPFSAYGYTPFYSYCLGIVEWLMPAGTDGKVVIKAVTIVFDYIAAGLVYALVQWRHQDARLSLLAFAAVLFAPTVFINGAWWGQSDIIYTSFLLASIYAFLREKPVLAVLAFGMALAIKLQALWLSPFILMLVLQRRIDWRLLALVPLVYVVVALPAVLAGRSMLEIALIYLTQAGTQQALNSSVANIQFFPHYFFTHKGLWPEIVPLFAKLSVLFTAGLCLFYAWDVSRRRLDRDDLLLAALVSVLIAPQFLPYMHNRYFFPADVLLIVLCFWRPRLWPMAVLMQLSSLSTYVPFLWGRAMLAEPVPQWLAWVGFTNNLQPVTGIEALFGLFNLGLLIWGWRELRQHRQAA